VEAESLEFLQQKSKQIIRAAAYLQALAIIIAGSILYFKPSSYREMGQCFSMLALFSSFAVARWYIYNGKKVEAMKTFSDEEGHAIKNEYILRFFAPYVLWVGCMWMFS